jgi:hypothetical protein
MVWEFKRTLYCARQRVSLASCTDLGDPKVQRRIGAFLSSQVGLPVEGADDEYAFYFELVYPAERDRRAMIDTWQSSAKPSYGHVVLGVFFKLGHTRVVWTTNFDRTVEDAAFKVLGSSGLLSVATLDTPAVAMQSVNEGRQPLLVKLHGDFQSTRLKNTNAELRHQDSTLRQALVECCRRFGLMVMGYSGRDTSVMEAIGQAVEMPGSFPAGLFWFHYAAGETVRPAVSHLIDKASETGIDAHIVECGTFDEVAADLALFVGEVTPDIEQHLRQSAPRVSDAPIPDADGTWPVVRTNALAILATPPASRRVVCSIGGLADVRKAVEAAGSAVVASRRAVGVIAFGSDAEIRRTFDPYNITAMDLHAIEEPRLRYDSCERGLLADVLTLALSRTRNLVRTRRGREWMVYIDAGKGDLPQFRALRQSTGILAGIVPGTALPWAEAVRLRLDHKLGGLWLMVEPTVWYGEPTEPQTRGAAREFVRRRLAARFNRVSNSILDSWVDVLSGGQREFEVRAFGIADGIDAVFTISSVTAFSRRQLS